MGRFRHRGGRRFRARRSVVHSRQLGGKPHDKRHGEPGRLSSLRGNSGWENTSALTLEGGTAATRPPLSIPFVVFVENCRRHQRLETNLRLMLRTCLALNVPPRRTNGRSVVTYAVVNHGIGSRSPCVDPVAIDHLVVCLFQPEPVTIDTASTIRVRRPRCRRDPSRPIEGVDKGV